MKKLVLILLITLTGCRPPLLIDPRTPVYINDSFGWVEIYVYDAKSNSLISMGWHNIRYIEGRTANFFPWDKYFREHE